MAEIINLNNLDPPPPSGYINVLWQKTATPTGTDPTTGSPIFAVSAYVTDPTASTGTHDEPLTDGNGNFIFAATLATGGDIIVVIGVPN